MITRLLAVTTLIFLMLVPMHVAWAGCAWVLWREVGQPGVNAYYLIVEAFETKAKCDTALATATRHKSDLRCLPDTIDPRRQNSK